MKINIISLINYGIKYTRDPLRKNAIYMIVANVVLSILGFLFWLLAARYYTTTYVGMATATISAASLLGTFSALGFTTGIIRYLSNEKDKIAMINSCFTIVGLFSIFLSVCFLWGLHIWSPALLFLRENIIFAIIFILLIMAYILFWIQYHIFVALRSAEFTIAQSLITGLRVLGLVFMIELGALGIISSFSLGFVISVAATFFFIKKLVSGYRTVISVNKNIVSKMVHFSFGNYLSDTFRSLPGLVIPIILINSVNAETSAYFYIALMIANILFMVIYSTGHSLLAEHSVNSNILRRQINKALIFNLLILVPVVIMLYFFGKNVLSIFGAGYSDEASTILWLLALATIPAGINEIYVTIFRIEIKVKPIMYMRAFTAIYTILASYMLVKMIGLAGIGIAWITGEFILLLILTPHMMQKLKIR